MPESTIKFEELPRAVQYFTLNGIIEKLPLHLDPEGKSFLEGPATLLNTVGLHLMTSEEYEQLVSKIQETIYKVNSNEELKSYTPEEFISNMKMVLMSSMSPIEKVRTFERLVACRIE